MEWLERFKYRHNIKFARIHGEKADADFMGADEWIRNVLPNEIEGYDPKDIFNADETGLVYKALQSATLTFHGTEPAGGKLPKQRLTALLCVNMDGSEKNAYIIGKYKKPRCFSRVQSLPLPYYNNQNSWMTSIVWKDILLKMNRKFEAQGRHIVLSVDNASSHQCNDPTPFVKVIFLPPNTTLIQPWMLRVIFGIFLSTPYIVTLRIQSQFIKNIWCDCNESRLYNDIVNTENIVGFG